jgi:hypothetical protein
MSDLDRLLEKLARIEALFTRPGCEGEKLAAQQAREQILARLAEMQRADPPIEFRFSMNDGWSQRLFLALLRRYGITPYRYRGQRRTTVMARVPKTFVDAVLWPEFTALSQTMKEFFDDFTTQVIAEVLQADGREAEEREPVAGIAE